MIKPKSEMYKPAKIEIDLTGPNGNAFYLMGLAQKLGRQIGLGDPTIDGIIEDMMSGDYENLLNIFDVYFGDFVDLYR